jgi:hypothetical protein
MSLSLHNVVRQAIQAVNQDIPGVWLPSNGNAVNGDGTVQPVYRPPLEVMLQVQPPTTRDLQHINFLNLQGVIRSVWMYFNPRSIDRVAVQGGDLLLYMQSQPQFLRDSNGQIVLDSNSQPVLISSVNDGWLVAAIDEWWDVDSPGWTKLYAVLQTDGRSWVLDSNGLPVLNSTGGLVYAT